MTTPTSPPTPIHTQRLTRNDVGSWKNDAKRYFLCSGYDDRFELRGTTTCQLEIFSEPVDRALKLTYEKETDRSYPLFYDELGLPIVLLDAAEELLVQLDQPLVYWRLTKLTTP